MAMEDHLAESLDELANVLRTLAQRAADGAMKAPVRTVLAVELPRLRVRFDAMVSLAGLTLDAPPCAPSWPASG